MLDQSWLSPECLDSGKIGLTLCVHCLTYYLPARLSHDSPDLRQDSARTTVRILLSTSQNKHLNQSPQSFTKTTSARTGSAESKPGSTSPVASSVAAMPARPRLPPLVSAPSLFFAPPSVPRLFATTASSVRAADSPSQS